MRDRPPVFNPTSIYFFADPPISIVCYRINGNNQIATPADPAF
jgi:hypothetical protein